MRTPHPFNVVFLIIFENEIILLIFIFVFSINIYSIFVVHMPNDTNHIAEMYYILYYIKFRYENER